MRSDGLHVDSSNHIDWTNRLILNLLAVIISDILIFFTGTVFYWIQSRNQLTTREKASIIFFNLFYPGLILVDHGHFQ